MNRNPTVRMTTISDHSFHTCILYSIGPDLFLSACVMELFVIHHLAERCRRRDNECFIGQLREAPFTGNKKAVMIHRTDTSNSSDLL